jgi:hypothetical protein
VFLQATLLLLALVQRLLSSSNNHIEQPCTY